MTETELLARVQFAFTVSFHILFPTMSRLALHRWRIRIFDLEPKRRAARAIDRAKPLRHDPLAAKPASLAKYDRAVLHEMLVEYDA
jgi:hypothetical protein